MTFGTIFRTIFSYLLLTLFLLSITPLLLIIVCIPQRTRYKSKVIFFLVGWMYRITLWCSLLPIRIYGKEYIPKTPAIFVANHQSALDIPLLGVLCNGYPHIWLARSEVMQMKFVRLVLPFFAVIVNLSDARQAMRSVRELLNISQETNAHIVLFPEGQRYIDGEVHEFLRGFVMLAKKTGRPVVPVCILGVHNAYPPQSFWMHWFPITVVVGKPFEYCPPETDEEFRVRVQEWFFMQTGQKR